MSVTICRHIEAGFGCTSLDERLGFERLLGDLSARFANFDGGVDAVIDEIEHAQQQLLEQLGFDRCTFGEFTDGDGAFVVLCSASVAGVAPMARGRFPAELEWLIGELRAGRNVVQTPLPECLPPQALAEAAYCRRTGIRTHVSLPLAVGGRVAAALGFGAFRVTRALPPDLIGRIRLVGEIFAQALARARTTARLAAALAEIRQLQDRLEAENRYLRESVPCGGGPAQLRSRSPRFQALLEELALVAPTGSTVLLTGETGTGKEVLAAAIHEQSGRQERAMVKVNCAALPATLIEAELFGREKGAYTGALARQVGRFELAHGSTIFLDEVAELPLELQAKLLRVLESRSFERLGGTQTIRVDVRVIAATNRDLQRAVAEGRFREDLYYRLAVFPIDVPPLRERTEDIPLLVWRFVREFGSAMGKPIRHIGDADMAALVAYAWPGNVRELRNVLERAMILTRDGTLRIAVGRGNTCPRPLPAAAEVATRTDGHAADAGPGTLAAVERDHIRRTLEACGWRVRGVGGAAAALAMKPTTLESRMKKLGIDKPR